MQEDKDMENSGITHDDNEPMDVGIEDEFDEESDDEELTVVEKIIGIYTAPVRTFKYLSDHPDFWWPLIIISLLAIGFSMANLPKMMPNFIEQGITAATSQPGMSEDDNSAAISMIEKIVPITVYVQTIIGTPIGLAIGWLISALLVFLTSLIQGFQADFKKLIGMLPWLSFVSILSEIGRQVVVLTKGDVSMTEFMDMRLMKPFSTAALVPESAPDWLATFLSAIDPFTIWSTILMVVAVQYANKCTRAQAIITVVIVTIIGLALMLGLSFLQTMQQTSAA